ncbi:MAG: FtsW/RodA/SpoVE family cell cycle protein [Elusimicrobiota bacterium]
MPSRADSGAKGRVDWVFMSAVLGLIVLGTIAMVSAASPLPLYISILQRHFFALFIGILLFLVGLGFNYQIFQDQAKALYIFVLILMTAVLVVGTVHKGQKSWIHLGFLTFQPAELARIGVILVLANFLDRRARKTADFSTVLWALAIAGPVMALIMKQPDMGSTVTFFPVIVAMLFCAGADLWHLVTVFGYCFIAAAVPLIFTYCQVRYPGAAAGTWPWLVLQTSRMGVGTVVAIALFTLTGLGAWRLSIMMRLNARPLYFLILPLILSGGLLSGIVINRHLKGYQRNRFVAYVAPQSDIQGASYNVHQAQIAIGSGGLWGKGLFSGTQGQLGFLPERHTDFIYAVVGEEMGFWGALSVLGLYMLLIWRIITAARLARDRYGFLVCCGIAAMFAFNLSLNAGMCLGLMPVAGIPLPLISYGGSSLMITLGALGIVANVYARRYSLL